MVYLDRNDIRTVIDKIFDLTDSEPQSTDSLKLQYGFVRGYLAAVHTLISEDEE